MVFAKMSSSPRASTESSRASDVKSDLSSTSYQSSGDSQSTKRRSVEIVGKLKRSISISRSPKKLPTEMEDSSPSSSPSKPSMLKRFSSLPRRPSSKASNGSGRTPSPLHDIPHPPSKMQVPPLPLSAHPHGDSLRLRHVTKIICSWPQAMVYADINTKKTAVERCRAYAQKINELYVHESGMIQFMNSLKVQGKYYQPLCNLSR